MPNVSIKHLSVFVSALALVAGLTTQVAAQAATSGGPAPGASRRYVAPPPAVPNRAQPPAPHAARPAEESTLPDVIYIQPFVGYGIVRMRAFDADKISIETNGLDDVLVPTEGEGLRYGVAGGINIVFVHLGLRLASTETQDFSLGTIQLEAALAPRLGPIEPSLRVGIGYAWQGNANYGNYQEQTSVYGLTAGVGIGLDVRLGQVVGIGVAVDGDFLNMSRSTDVTQLKTINAADGAAIGAQVAFTGHLTLHI